MHCRILAVKLHASSASALNTFSGYGDGYVLVNGQRHAENIIVMPEQLLPWAALSFVFVWESAVEASKRHKQTTMARRGWSLSPLIGGEFGDCARSRAIRIRVNSDIT